MTRAGLEALAPFDRLSMNGFKEPLLRLPELLGMFRRLRDAYVADPPDVFVGVDFNVFNLLLERALKKRGLRTVHYVSPSVYAWRRGRVKRIARAADMLLALYPFEPAFYDGEPVVARYVGHPLADRIDPDAGSDANRIAMRRELAIAPDAHVLALLPGSRMSEVRLLLDDFLEAARGYAAARVANGEVDRVTCLIPCINDRVAGAVAARVDESDSQTLAVRLLREHARRALVAADLALVKSGTSTLEAMLLRRPMVVSYRLGELTYQLVRRLVRAPYVALPNILAGEALVPELLQHDATPVALTRALVHVQGERGALGRRFAALHAELRCDADERAADAVIELVSSDAPDALACR